MHIELEAVGAGGESPIEGDERVFRPDLAAAAMGKDKRAV
jgi:hypothetical protein